jgi:3-oxoacyl-(acyl-carrier-protein) synthase
VSAIYVNGLGAVSPAGWTLAPFRDALAKRHLLPSQELPRPGFEKPLRIMRVPAPDPRPAFLTHARLRRTSPITQFAVGAAVEALGQRKGEALRDVGVIVCVLSGCVNYSRRFYGETLKDPATASPLVFPETVFNAPASHIAAYMASNSINYTLVGDAGTFLTAMAIGATWLLEGKVRECLVVGTEEIDWLTADAIRLFDRSKFLSEGAGAVLLSTESTGALAQLDAITDEFLYNYSGGKTGALKSVREQLRPQTEARLLCDSTSNASGISREETEVWSAWTGARIAPKRVLGEGLMAAAAWQVVAAVDALASRTAAEALVSIAGFHQHALGCRFVSPA